MKHSITLVFNTKNSVIHANISLQADSHVDLAYRIVEAGIYGTMPKKHWSFAIIEDRTILAMLPMYKRHETTHPVNGSTLVRYEPRIPHNQVRDSYERLLLTLQALSEVNPKGTHVELNHEDRRVAQATPELATDRSNLDKGAEDLGNAVLGAVQTALMNDVPMPTIEIVEGSPTLVEWEAIPTGEATELGGDAGREDVGSAPALPEA